MFYKKFVSTGSIPRRFSLPGLRPGLLYFGKLCKGWWCPIETETHWCRSSQMCIIWSLSCEIQQEWGNDAQKKHLHQAETSEWQNRTFSARSLDLNSPTCLLPPHPQKLCHGIALSWEPDDIYSLLRRGLHLWTGISQCIPLLSSSLPGGGNAINISWQVL